MKSFVLTKTAKMMKRVDWGNGLNILLKIFLQNQRHKKAETLAEFLSFSMLMEVRKYMKLYQYLFFISFVAHLRPHFDLSQGDSFINPMFFGFPSCGEPYKMKFVCLSIYLSVSLSVRQFDIFLRNGTLVCSDFWQDGRSLEYLKTDRAHFSRKIS